MRVLHEFVDTEGRTQFDEFNTDLPFDMGDIPDTAYVLLMLRSNARRIAELHKECDDGTGKRRLYICCPQPGLPEVGKWECAKDTVRRLGFENVSPAQGGLRATTSVDYVNASVVAMAHEMHRSITAGMRNVPESSRDGLSGLRVARQQYESADHGKIAATMSAHPLWRRVSWISGMNVLTIFNFIGAIVDPTWYVQAGHPYRSGLFKERCGLYNPVESMNAATPYTDAMMCLASSFLMFFQNEKKVPLKELNDPSQFFLRYGMLWMQHYAKAGEDAHNAFLGGLWRYSVKLASFIWLNWLECTHREMEGIFDDARFFFGESKVSSVCYRAAVS